MNLQEVQEVQGGLWNPSCPVEKHKVGQQEKKLRLVEEVEETLGEHPHHGSGAGIRSLHTIILSSKVLYGNTRADRKLEQSHRVT